MEIREVSKEQINSFIGSQKQAQFLQSWEWGEFQKKAGCKVLRYGFYENGRLIWVMILIKKPLFFGKSYLYAPRIIIKNLSENQINDVFITLRKIARQENAIFLRFEPLSKLQVASYKLRVRKTLDVQPSKTLIIDISKSEEEILKAMHQKTRYNIRLAKKKGVEAKEGKKENFDDFWKIMKDTKDRDKFRLHKKEYYREMLDIDYVKLFLAYWGEDLISGIIVSFFGDMAVYIHGASANKFRNMMAPYALQWEAIKEAKSRGFKYYDLNGADEIKWPGVTRFKKGFGGEEINYPGTYDFAVFNNWYKIYKILRNIRRRF